MDNAIKKSWIFSVLKEQKYFSKPKNIWKCNILCKKTIKQDIAAQNWKINDAMLKLNYNVSLILLKSFIIIAIEVICTADQRRLHNSLNNVKCKICKSNLELIPQMVVILVFPHHNYF